jgi:leucyl aminopeptidase (aminopeptidase T)
MGLLPGNVKDRKRLMKAAHVALDKVMHVKKGETVLIVTNPQPDVHEISMALFDVAFEAGAKPTIVVQRKKTQMDAAEDAVVMAIRSKPDLILSISAEKLGKDPDSMAHPIIIGKGKKARTYNHYFNYLLYEGLARSFWSPSVTKNMFIRTVPIDYARLRNEARAVKSLLDKGDRVHITTKKGMDMDIGIKGRVAHMDDGDFSRKGSGGNLPAGEVYISPQLGASNGTIVFDGSIASDKGVIVIRRPIKVYVKGGFVTRVHGGPEASRLNATLRRANAEAVRLGRNGKVPKKLAQEYARNSHNLGELGIGLNPAATIVGNILEDEKVYRTCHIAIGANYDQDAEALIHLDGIIKDPTITVYKGDQVVGIIKGGRVIGR